MAQNIFCTNCGQDVTGHNFCINCGTKATIPDPIISLKADENQHLNDSNLFWFINSSGCKINNCTW